MKSLYVIFKGDELEPEFFAGFEYDSSGRLSAAFLRPRHYGKVQIYAWQHGSGGTEQAIADLKSMDITAHVHQFNPGWIKLGDVK